MRNFIIATICIAILVSTWVVFNVYSHKMTNACAAHTDKLITEYIAEEKWDDALNEFSQLADVWNRYKKFARYFLDIKELNEIEATLDKSLLYIEANDVSNSTGELSYVKEKISNIHRNDAILLQNIL